MVITSDKFIIKIFNNFILIKIFITRIYKHASILLSYAMTIFIIIPYLKGKLYATVFKLYQTLLMSPQTLLV